MKFIKWRKSWNVFIKNLNFFLTEERKTWTSWKTWGESIISKSFFLKVNYSFKQNNRLQTTGSTLLPWIALIVKVNYKYSQLNTDNLRFFLMSCLYTFLTNKQDSCIGLTQSTEQTGVTKPGPDWCAQIFMPSQVWKRLTPGFC